VGRSPRRQAARRPGPAPAARRRDAAGWIVVALALLANAPVLFADYVLDDHALVEQDPRVVETRLGDIWSTSYWGFEETTREYRPLVLTSYAIERAILGPAPWHFHAVNWLLHAVVTLAVLRTGRALGMGERAAALAAGLFAVHPLHLDAIAPVVGRAELLAALGVLPPLALWLRARRAPEPRPLPLLGLAGCLALGLFSKETALAAAPLLVLVELLLLRGAGRRTLWAASAAAALPVVAFLATRAAVLGSVLPGESATTALENPLVEVPLGTRLLTAAALLGHALRLFVWPWPLAPNYAAGSLPVVTDPIRLDVWLPVLLLAAAAALAAECWRRRPEVTLAVAAFAAPYAVVSNALVPIGTLFGERLLYLPSVGLCWLVGLGCAALIARVPGAGARIVVASLAAAGVALVAASLERADDWRDEEAVYREAARAYPDTYHHWLNLGAMAMQEGRYREALDRVVRATELAPDFGPAWAKRGSLHALLGEEEAAREALERAVALRPDDFLSLENLAELHRARGRSHEALRLEARARRAREQWRDRGL